MTTRKRRRSKLDPFLDQLGIVSDTELARLAGVTPANVGAYRRRRGIPARWRGVGQGAAEPQAHTESEISAPRRVPAPRQTKKAKGRKRRKSKLDPYLDRLGVLPDQKVADLAGVTLGNVRAYRYRHGIASPRLGARITGAQVEPKVAPTPAPAPKLAGAKPYQRAPAPKAPVARAEPPAAPPVVAEPQPQPMPAASASGEHQVKAFRVKVEGVGGTVAYVVIAENIAEDASKALRTLEQRRVEGEVLSVEYLAMALQR